MDDIALAFDPTGFLTGIKAVENQLVSLNSNFQKAGDTGEKKNQKLQLSAMNILGVFGKLGMVVGGFKMALSGIPEIGKTFQIAGDIFQRNFLWPLRKELIPILQSVLNWFRDNRAMFVKWGTVLANVFRAVFSIIKSLIKMAKDLFDQLMAGLEGIFGKTTNSITEMANLILFKITAIVMFIMMTLEPIFKWLVDQIIKIIGYIKSFVDGFMEGFGDMTPVFKEFIGLWKQLNDFLDKILPSQGKMNSLFKILGSILGTVVLTAVLSIVQAIDFMVHNLSKAATGFQQLKAAVSGNFDEVEKLQKQQQIEDLEYQQRQNRRSRMVEASAKRTWNVITEPKAEVTPKEQVLPKAQITSTKTNDNKTTIQNDNKTVNININEVKDPQKTAETTAQKLREANFQTGRG